ncbi:MAG: PA2169 family four-helix-bundle protein [Chloroflexota bacterium]|nr:PA2169 family four-helix-bundle protein [Chloroflexota bacterium]
MNRRGLSDQTRKIRELNALIETHLDSVEVLEDALEGAESPEVRQAVQAMHRDHQHAAIRLQTRVRELGGTPATGPHATNKLKEAWQAMWEGGGDEAVLMALRANERVAVDGFKAQLLKEGMIQTMTGEGLREHREALEMELRHFQRETDLLRERGVAVDNDEMMGAVRNAVEHLYAALNLSGTAVEAFLKYATGTASR